MKKIFLLSLLALLCACGVDSSSSENTSRIDSGVESSEIISESISSNDIENSSSSIELGWH